MEAPISNPLQASVIIPFYGQYNLLDVCLHQLSHQTLPRERFEVICVNNDSRPTPEWLLQKYPTFAFLQETKPGSFAARNLGVSQATGDILLFTDADCIPEFDWIENAVADLAEKAEHVFLAGKISLCFGRGPLTCAELYDHVFTFDQKRNAEKHSFSVTANLIVRRSLFKKVGEFNSILYSSGDLEWCNRAKSLGAKIQYSDSAAIVHPARRHISDQIKRMVRIEGGYVSIERLKIDIPTIHEYRARWLDVFVPRRHLANILRSDKLKGPLQRTQVYWLRCLMNLVACSERLRLRIHGSPIRF